LTGHYDAVEIEKHTPPDHYNMVFTTNRVAAEFMKSWSAKKLAADYREGERRDMFQQGVLTGMYQLKDERQWEEEIGGKKFYAASAIMVTEKMNVKQYLYLYFPREVNVNRFFIALYNEGHPTGKPLEASFKDQFLEALKTLKWNTWVN
jgi:hypothetical protein